MTKNNPGPFNCYEKAEPNEPMFVLLGRDISALPTIYSWIGFRIMKGQSLSDPQIQEAITAAKDCHEWAKKLGKVMPKELEDAMNYTMLMLQNAVSESAIASALDEQPLPPDSDPEPSQSP